MFFIGGISQGEKQLPIDQTVICKRCGRFGHLTVWVRYSYFMFFFIPLFKWGRRYYARMTCCGAACELPEELGRSIEQGRVTALDPDRLDFGVARGGYRRCPRCGFSTAEEFQYCPHCGAPLR